MPLRRRGGATDFLPILRRRKDTVKAAIGKGFDFGAIFGHRTYATVTIGPPDIELVSNDPADIAVIERLIGRDDIYGLNPLKYLEDL